MIASKKEDFVSTEQQLSKEKIKKLIKYSFELKKVGLVDSLRQNVASELTSDQELNQEIENILSIISYYLKNKEIDHYLKDNYPNWQEYRNNILNMGLLDTLEAKLKLGEVNINKVQEIINRVVNDKQ